MFKDRLKAARHKILQKAIFESETDQKQLLEIEKLKQEFRREYAKNKENVQEKLKSLIEESLKDGSSEPLEDVETLNRTAREYRAFLNS